ncbi:MAG: type II toxin-antitoxin system RelE/ParE family toxin [Candidatus Omnitrophota bacterium]
MIQSYKDKETQQFFAGKEVRKFRSVDRALAYKRHDYLNAAHSLSDIPPLKSFHLHPLTGNRKGQWAISLNGPWRLCFEFKEGNAYNVEIVDYHS